MLAKIKNLKTALTILAFPLLVISIIAFVPAKQAHALTYTCTWTNGDSTSIWSDPLNWSGCNSAAPQNGDSLIFNTSILSSEPQGNITNDISSLQVANITIEGGGSYNYNISGNAISLSNGITNNATSPGSFINVGMTLTANQTFAAGSTGLDIGVSSANFNLGSNTLNISGADGVRLYSPIVGTGTINYSITSSIISMINESNPSFNGAVVINSGIVVVNVSQTDPLGTGTVTVNNGGNLQISINSNGTYTIANPITMAGNTSNGAIHVDNFTGSGTSTVDFTGAVSLTANSEVNLNSANADFQGAVSGCGYTISELSGASGTLSGNLTGSCTTASSGSSSGGGTTATSSRADPSASDPDTGYGTPASALPKYIAMASGLLLVSGLGLRKIKEHTKTSN
jgi:hypothetical protein